MQQYTHALSGRANWWVWSFLEKLAYVLQVEKAPTVIKSGLKKEEAEELKKKLEAGAQLLRLISDASQALMPITCVRIQHAP